MENWKIESLTKYFLDRIGKPILIEANLEVSRDEYGYEDRNYELVEGLEYRFDNFYIKGYQYHDIYCIEIKFINSSYIVHEDGKISNWNEDIWYPYFYELYNSLDDLIKNQKAGEEFSEKYKYRIPWKKFTDSHTNEETKKYIRELNITLVARQTIIFTSIDMRENHDTYKIYDGQECVYDTEKNVFIDGEWKIRLINYIKAKERKEYDAWEAKKALEAQENFDEAYRRIRAIQNKTNNKGNSNYPQY